MTYSLITPCLPSEVDQLLALKNNLARQTTLDFEWIIAINTPLDLQSPQWQAPFTIKQTTFTPATVGAARNRAIELARQDWLVFVDSDDYLLPNALSELTAIRTTEDATILYDLNQYPTYEPQDAFVASTAQSLAQDDLPKWGGRKKHQQRLPVNIPAELTRDQPSAITNWLAHRYVALTAEQRYSEMPRQMKITGKVVNRQLTLDHELIFDPGNPLYADDVFISGVLAQISEYRRLSQPTYVRVHHNDPINHPSLHQLDEERRWFYRVAAWQTALDALPNTPVFTAYATYTLKRIHRYLYAALAHRTATLKPADIPELMTALQTYLIAIPGAVFNQALPRYSRHILLKIRQNGVCPQHAVNQLVRLREVNRLIHHHGRGVTRVSYMWWFTKLPIKQKTIFYESFLGRNYSDSPKAIYEYLQKNYPGQYHHVWVMNPGVTPNPGNREQTTVVKRFSWRYMYYLAVSKYQVINMRQPQWFVKRPGTKFLSTWHGTPLKHLVFDMDNVASANPLYKAIFYHQSRQWDYLVTANQFSADVFEHAFMYPAAQMLHSGYPRNDLLSAPDKAERARAIKQRLGIPLDKKIILYAPTWRDDDYYGVGAYKFTLKLDIARLRRELGDEYVLVLRTHYFITEHLDTTGFGDFVYNESSYNDIAELYLISDVLITDYSSVFFDYAILKRPILYFVYDYEKYEGVLRGFYLDMNKDLPGPLLKTNDEVLSALHDLPALEKAYAPAYARFSQRFNAWEDGHASQRVVEAFFGDDLPAKK